MLPRKLRHHNQKILFFSLIFTLVAVMYIFFKIFYPDEIDRGVLLHHIELSLLNDYDEPSCVPPKLPVNAPEIMKYIHNTPPIDCSKAEMNWVRCKGSICSIQSEAKNKYGRIQCHFTEIIRVDDHENSFGKTVLSESIYQLTESDVVKVSCWSPELKWSAVLTTVRKNDTLWKESSWDKVPIDALKMNILMFGIDSMSRNSFIRKLTKTYNYLTKDLKGVVLEGYNIVGDGTPQALIPILTGKTELELPDTRNRFSNSQYVNSYPMIWDEFKKAGYVTGFLEDLPYYGTFTYRLKGFKESPTDHYMRPYYLAESSEYNKWPDLCTGDTPRHKIMTNFIKDFFQVYHAKPKFMFGFHGELSHDDYNLVGSADVDFRQFLSELHDSDMLNNTMLIVFADHGHRFAAIRNTLQGKQEERLPFFSVVLPEWFKRRYPIFYRVLRSNANRLSTPFDVHATLKNMLNPDANFDENTNKRSFSLFSKIPKDRTCSRAFIEPHWCACLIWESVDVSSPIVAQLTNNFIETLNNYTVMHRNLCDIWKLGRINWVHKLNPNERLVKFKKSIDRDGFLADLSADVSIHTETYQINVKLFPENALFEATITRTLGSNNFAIKMSDVSRINMYGKQAKCIEDEFPNLRKYCHCII